MTHTFFDSTWETTLWVFYMCRSLLLTRGYVFDSHVQFFAAVSVFAREVPLPVNCL